MINFEEINSTHILAIFLVIVVIYCIFLRKPNEKFGEIPRLGPIDKIVDSYSTYLTPYTHGIPYNSSLCHLIKDCKFCKSRINCKWDDYNGCRYYGEGKMIGTDHRIN